VSLKIFFWYCSFFFYRPWLEEEDVSQQFLGPTTSQQPRDGLFEPYLVFFAKDRSKAAEETDEPTVPFFDKGPENLAFFEQFFINVVGARAVGVARLGSPFALIYDLPADVGECSLSTGKVIDQLGPAFTDGELVKVKVWLELVGSWDRDRVVWNQMVTDFVLQAGGGVWEQIGKPSKSQLI